MSSHTNFQHLTGHKLTNREGSPRNPAGLGHSLKLSEAVPAGADRLAEVAWLSLVSA